METLLFVSILRMAFVAFIGNEKIAVGIGDDSVWKAECGRIPRTVLAAKDSGGSGNIADCARERDEANQLVVLIDDDQTSPGENNAARLRKLGQTAEPTVGSGRVCCRCCGQSRQSAGGGSILDNAILGGIQETCTMPSASATTPEGSEEAGGNLGASRIEPETAGASKDGKHDSQDGPGHRFLDRRMG